MITGARLRQLGLRSASANEVLSLDSDWYADLCSLDQLPADLGDVFWFEDAAREEEQDWHSRMRQSNCVLALQVYRSRLKLACALAGQVRPPDDGQGPGQSVVPTANVPAGYLVGSLALRKIVWCIDTSCDGAVRIPRIANDRHSIDIEALRFRFPVRLVILNVRGQRTLGHDADELMCEREPLAPLRATPSCFPPSPFCHFPFRLQMTTSLCSRPLPLRTA